MRWLTLFQEFFGGDTLWHCQVLATGKGLKNYEDEALSAVTTELKKLGKAKVNRHSEKTQTDSWPEIHFIFARGTADRNAGSREDVAHVSIERFDCEYRVLDLKIGRDGL